MKTLLKMLRHKSIVDKNFKSFIAKLEERNAMHDISKYMQDEFDGFAELDSAEVFKLYGTDEYKKKIAENTGIKLHYQRNSHHPEHFYADEANFGFAFSSMDVMTFTDLLEMVIDWKSACETYGTSFEDSLEISMKRFLPSLHTEYMVRMIASDLYGTKPPAVIGFNREDSNK